ncbi:MAG: alpha/beta fold hydrolase [Halioglobus sp.]|nr:alpha/beta fold hydrolase [Halioglobus sp.]
MKPPNLLLALSDAPRALTDVVFLKIATPLLRKLPPTQRPQSVMVIPGFLGDDRGNQPLIEFLRHLGHTAVGWGQGRNLGTQSFDEDRLRESMEPLVAAGNGKVALVGHSLGGIYAREIARSEPDSIAQVITLGSPFGRGRQNASRANRLYQRLNPQPDERGYADMIATPPPVPTTAIYTKADGVVNWRTSVQAGSNHHVHNIEVLGSHIGLNVNAAVWYWIAKKLG